MNRGCYTDFGGFYFSEPMKSETVYPPPYSLLRTLIGIHVRKIAPCR